MIPVFQPLLRRLRDGACSTDDALRYCNAFSRLTGRERGDAIEAGLRDIPANRPACRACGSLPMAGKWLFQNFPTTKARP